MNKPIHKSKTMWSAGILIVLSLYQIIMNGAIDPTSLTTVFTALGLGGLRDSLK